MSPTPHATRLAATIDRLLRRARAKDIPAAVAEYAARATSRAFSSRPYDASTERRMDAYFSAVVRRRLVRSESGGRAVARMMAETVVGDLERSGRPPMAIWGELERGWSHAIPADVLEEYRARLCA